MRADLAVTAWLVPTVPADLEIPKGDKAPSDLSPLAITLHLPKSDPTRQAAELARYLRDGLSRLKPAA